MLDRLITIDQLLSELDKYNHKELHVHHTWRPNHANFDGSNYQKIQGGMRNYHVNTRKFSDIAQHVTLFPDGKFLTGRNFGTNPASISGFNTGAFCVEMLGDFDKGQDKFEGKQKEAMLKLAQYFDNKKRYVRFHRENAPKTCPGTSIDKAVFMEEVRKLTAVKGVSDVKEAPKPPKYPGKLIKVGDKGATVKLIQAIVGVKVDGVFGKLTESAVKTFQKRNKLTADGIVGAKTWGAMFK